MKKGSAVKKIGMFMLFAAVTIFVVLMLLSMDNIADIFDVVKTAEMKYILIAGILTLVYALLMPLTVCLLAKSKKTKVSFGNTFVIGMTEHFFNGITPFATGGQPFQVYALNKVKVKPSESTGILLMNFILFMFVTNAYAICSLFFYGKFTSMGQEMHIIAIVGFTMNFLVLVFMVSLATSKRLRSILSKLVLLLCKIKFLKKVLEPRVPELNMYFEQVQVAFKDLLKRKGIFISCIGIKIVTMAIYYSITFYILKAVHVEIGYNDLFFVICGTSFAITMVVFLPTPGSSGGIEFAFKSIFASIAGVSASIAYGGTLIWRLLSYYMLMIVSLFFYLGFEIYYAKVFKKRLQRQQHLEGNIDEELKDAPQVAEQTTVQDETIPKQNADSVLEE